MKNKISESSKLIRVIDLYLASAGLVATSPLLCALWVAGHFDTGAPLFKQVRVGRHKKPFTLLKFRTMSVGTADTATHLVDSSHVTSFGAMLRKFKLDELPQLINVIKGEMSLVGPRPNLPNQSELICEREKAGVYEVKPGITGLAQTNGVDMSEPEILAIIDKEMIENLNLKNYFSYLFTTCLGKGFGDKVRD